MHHLDVRAARAQAKSENGICDEVIWTADGIGLPAFPCSGDMAALRKAMLRRPYDQILHGKESLADRTRAAKRVDKTLANWVDN